ncbi:MAG: ferritin-like domain-containing protein [Candidatus Hydrothermarchaeaceae archaeon]
MEGRTTFDIIREDLNYEMVDIGLYYENLFRIKDEKVRDTVLHVLHDSLRHALILTGILRNLGQDFEIEDEIGHEELVTVLQKGLQEEKNGVALYNEHLRLIESVEIHRKIREIFNDEMEHEKLVEDALEYLKR